MNLCATITNTLDIAL